MNEQKQFGLKPLPPDERDFKLGAVFPLPKLSKLPDNFRLMILGIKDQGASDLCTAYASCGASELQEKVELNPEYSFALSKSLSGDPDEWGQDLRKAMHAHQKFGAVEESLARPFIEQFLRDHPENGRQLLRRIEHWPAHFKEEAARHAKGSLMAITGPYDPFDNLRATLWLFRKEYRAGVFGVQWAWDLAQYFMTIPQDAGFGHALYEIGFEKVAGEHFLVIVGSNGEGAGDGGLHYFNRNVVNAFVKQYGAFMFQDMTPEEYRARMLPTWQRTLNAIREAALEMLRTLFLRQQTDPVPAVPPFEPAELVKAPEPIQPRKSRIEAWARAIEKFENMKKNYPGHNNPGALRFSRFQTGVKNGYSTFATYEDGWKGLIFQLTIACDGRSDVYTPEDTLLQFCEKYAPKSDNNHPASYARFVALELGVTPQTKIKTLL